MAGYFQNVPTFVRLAENKLPFFSAGFSSKYIWSDLLVLARDFFKFLNKNICKFIGKGSDFHWDQQPSYILFAPSTFVLRQNNIKILDNVLLNGYK